MGWNLFRYAMHGKVADGEKVFSLFFHPFALKSDLRILFRVKEISSAQMLVAPLYAGINTCSLDNGANRRL